MYFKRKIDSWLNNWKQKKEKNPALIMGIRQCGKTKSVEVFAKQYSCFIKLNFWNNPEFTKFFNGPLDVNTIMTNIALHFSETIIKEHNTLLFFDEIQECPRARLAFKNFALDGRYDVIGSGSYLGINGYISNDTTPIPVGYEDIFHMHTMDFEEFLWANNYSEEQIFMLKDHFLKREKMPESAHNLFKGLFTRYACVGGFPSAVKSYIENDKSIISAYRTNNNIVFEIKNDFGRRINKNGQIIFKPSEVARIQNTFDLIPFFLGKENKRFITSKIEKGKSQDKIDAIEYLKQAHIVNKVYNTSIPSLPLIANIEKSQFKLFPEDIAIVTSMFGIETLQAMNSGDLGQSKGAIYESLLFDALSKNGFDLYYFAKESGLEIDFVISYNGYAYLVEAKAKSGNTKSSKTVMNNPNHYGKTKLLKVGDYQVGEVGDILTIPHYMMFLISNELLKKF